MHIKLKISININAGAREMYTNGLLATVDVTKLAKAHVCVYEGMKDNAASGRYICFDRVISTADDAATFAAEIGVPIGTIVQTTPPVDSPISFQLSNKKLSDLMARSNLQRSCLNENRYFWRRNSRAKNMSGIYKFDKSDLYSPNRLD